MFRTQAAPIVPNLLHPEDHPANRPTVFPRHAASDPNPTCSVSVITGAGTFCPQPPQNTNQIKIDEGRRTEKPNFTAKLSKLLIDFGQMEESSQQDEEAYFQLKNGPSSQRAQIDNSVSTQTTTQHPSIDIKKNVLLLQMDFYQQQIGSNHEQISSNHEPQDQLQATASVQTTPAQADRMFNRKLLLELDEEQLSQISQQQASKHSDVNLECRGRVVMRLTDLLSRFQTSYYLEPIPLASVFQCVVKRDRCESSLKYHLYDSLTLRNFMTIIKDEYGYLVICKVANRGQSRTLYQQTAVARISSNFFGTEFNCTLQKTPYVRGYSYPVAETTQKVITVEYEANLFGLKGPRKIAAFIPTSKEHKYQCLNQVYQLQLRKKKKPTVLKFKNKMPEWCEEIKAYALNFGGRACVCSIKNFVLVGQDQGQDAQQTVLFGKFGRQLFNLDVRYPFSILQGVCLAVSSFDRKLAVQ